MTTTEPRSLPVPVADSAATEARCDFAFADGRRCRMPRAEGSQRCPVHSRRQPKPLTARQLARELAPPSGEFKTASDVNHVIGKAFSLFAQSRLDRRDALAFAYMGQLLLQSLPSVRREVKDAHGHQAWLELLRDSLDHPPTLTAEADAADEAET